MTEVPARANLITLGVADVGVATRFYEALGWRRSSESVDGEVSFLLTTGTIVALWGRAALAEDAGFAQGDPPAFAGVALAINLDSREAVDAAVAAWVEAGGRVVRPMREVPFGYQGYVADPDGHLWELAWNPGFGFRPDGTLDLP